ncbi:MAG: B12-binding domain-containing radical SAM protein [Deltaproteobacteria bacterium]|jgi:radical SAM superfamily enzyme YgiQ (UPF0313 family)|nr:B12-binding domain-containing radical SAM protein [Deltaproteobacteria bacterium]
MNILLCLPRTSVDFRTFTVLPIGVAYISSSLKKAGFNVIPLNFFLVEERDTEAVMRSMIEEHSIDIVATGDLLANLPVVKNIIDTAKRIKPSIITIIGGRLVTHSPHESMQLIDNADYGVIGEGEITTCELVQALISGKKISDVAGLVYRDKDVWGNATISLSAPRKEVPNLDELEWPDYEGLRLFEVGPPDKRAAALVTSRSCPFRCTFCVHHRKTKYRQRSLDSIFEELAHIVEKYKISHFYITDELFSEKEARLIEFCKRVSQYKVTWDLSMRINSALTRRTLELMRDAGCIRLRYGLESADDRVLQSMNKQITVAQMEQALKLAHEAGLPVSGGFIFGDIAETIETANVTKEWLRRNKHYLAETGACMITVYPGSKLWDYAVDKGIIANKLEHIQQGCPYINISGMTDEEHRELITGIVPSINKMLEEISDYAKTRNFSVDDENNRYTVEMFCSACKQWHCVPLPPMRINNRCTCVCPQCSYPSVIYCFNEYIQIIDSKLNALLHNYNCAVWGIGKSWDMAYQSSKALQDPNNNYALIDLKKGHLGLSYNEKTIYPPPYVGKNNINFIIETIGFTDEIKKILARDGAERIPVINIGMIGIMKDI